MELIIWNKLRKKQLNGFRFRRQHPIDEFIFDFYCPQVRLAIEIDDIYHDSQFNDDQKLTEWLKRHRVCVIHFTNREVKENLNEVLDKILEQCDLRSI